MKKIAMPKVKAPKPPRAGVGKLKVVAQRGKVIDPGYFRKNPISKTSKI